MTDQTSRRQQAIDDLLTLIRKFASESLLEEIADGDSQAMPKDAAKHMAALQSLRDTYDWSLKNQPNNHRYPCEPIELISYAVDHHSQRTQVFCNALLLLAHLQGSERADMHYRWFKSPGEAWFRSLHDPWRSALLAGFSALHAEVCELEKGFWDEPDAKGKWINPRDEVDG